MKMHAPRKETPDRLATLKPLPTPAADWVIEEFARVALPDARHRWRLQRITTAFAQKPAASIPQACAAWAEAKGAYRFLANDRIDPGSIRQAHRQAMLERVRAYPVVLAVQDTTALNYSTHPKTQGLGPLGSPSAKIIGFFLHSTLALTPTGQALGFLHSAVRVRPGQKVSVHRHQRKLADKESYKWVESLTACQALAPACPQTQLVNVADREGDLYDLFAQALQAPESARVELLVRARHARQLADRETSLWATVRRQRLAAKLAVRVGRKGDQPSRVARLHIRFCKVQLQAPGSPRTRPRYRSGPLKQRKFRCPRARLRFCGGA